MRLYKLNKSPYDASYDTSIDTPRIWWLAIDDTNNYLQQLALQVLGIMPHSAGCERVFSALGWMYGKCRLRLSTTKIEAMAKIRTYCVSKINDELKYLSQNYDLKELKQMVEEAIKSIEDGDDDRDEDTLDNTNQEEFTEVSNTDTPALIIEDFFDLNEVPFMSFDNIEFENSDSENEEINHYNNFSDLNFDNES